MKTIRIYQPGEYQINDTITLSEKAGQHVGVVLRKQPGEILTLFSGDNHEYQAEINTVHKKKVTVTITNAGEVNRESQLSIHLAQSISKGERMELVIQKATELGVASITPVISARTVVKLDTGRLEKKHNQWHAIAISACEQCGRNIIPVIHPPIALPQYLKQLDIQNRLILDPGAGLRFKNIQEVDSEVALLIGPEGGFNMQEIAETEQSGFSGISLGPRVLRTETAAITALSLLQAFYGDL